jgi:hypothetical protein
LDGAQFYRVVITDQHGVSYERDCANFAEGCGGYLPHEAALGLLGIVWSA